VRTRLHALDAEHQRLRAVPVPSGDIAERLKAYVAALTRATIEGIGPGEELKVRWPDDPLSLLAILAPDRVLDALTQEVTRVANTPMPPPQRKLRMTAILAEITNLYYVEEILVEAEHGERRSAAPGWAILGAAIVVPDADKKKSA
jgi:hypothetical protein